MFRLRCQCGHLIEIRSSQAGSSVTCPCGKVCQVPPLRELRAHEECGEATPVTQTVSTMPTESLGPQLQLMHCCGIVGRQGNVSHLALRNYLQLVQIRIAKYLDAHTPGTARFLGISIALAPEGQQLVEYDIYPTDASTGAIDQLIQSITQIAPPLVHDLPVAFAILVQKDPTDRANPALKLFPSLNQQIEKVGLQAALWQFMEQRKSGKKISWWRRLWSRGRVKLPQRPPDSPQKSLLLAQEDWVTKCETYSDRELVDLKRVIIERPDEPAFRLAFAAKLSQEKSWKKALEWYDDLLCQLDCQVSLWWRRAAIHTELDNFDAALQDYSRAIERAPFFPELYFLRAQIHCKFEAWDKVDADLNESIRLAPHDSELYYCRGYNSLLRSQPEAAANDFREAIRLDPNFGYAHFQLGWVCCLLGKGNEAIDHLSRAVELTGHDSDVRLHRSLAYLMQNKLALALADCDEILAVQSENAAAHGLRGRILQNDGQFQEAIEACTRAIDLNLEDAAVYLARAISYASTEQLTLAEYDCDTALALEPDYPLAMLVRGRLKLQEGDLDAAMTTFNRARELAPDWAEPREQLSLVHRMKEDPQAAVDELTQLINDQPQQPSHYVNRAFAWTQMQSYAEAAKDFDRALELDPENEEIVLLRGIFRMNCQERELALADFERVLALVGDHDTAREYRAALLLQLRRFEEAIEDFAQLIAKHPENHNAYSGRAFAFASLGNNERAQEDAERLAAIAPELAESAHKNTQVANLYRLVSEENYDAAMELAEQLVIDYPDQSFGYRLRGYVHWEREEYVEADEDYSHVIDIDGPTSTCLSSRGQIRAELGELSSAMEDLNQSIDLARKAGETIVLAYALNGRSLTNGSLARDEASEQDYEESIRLCPTNPWAYYHRGIRKFNAGELTEAKVMLEMALEFNEPPLSKRKKQRVRAALDKIANGPQT